MLTVAYLANQFPSAVEPYVADEIEELQRRGVRVIAGSVREPAGDARGQAGIILQSMPFVTWLRAAWLCVRRWERISPVMRRVVFCGREGPLTRVKALVHTWLGACYAVLIEDRGIDHIHAHHGYFGSWVAMVAARLLGAAYSLTLHGSDVLLHGKYLDVKLENCSFCVTVSEYNRWHVLRHYAGVDPDKLLVARLGVEVPAEAAGKSDETNRGSLTMVAVGRLHAVKDHAFLVRACAELQNQGVAFECLIAGDGPERRSLESKIARSGLEGKVTLLGHVPREQMDSLYDRADLVVLTSRSEGIPLVLMEAMARGKIVVAPAITGIPELVTSGKSGFLYKSGNLDDLVDRLLWIRSLIRAKQNLDIHPQILLAARQLDWVRHAARVQVRLNFNRARNLESFGEIFLQRIAPQTVSTPHEDLVLQQI